MPPVPSYYSHLSRIFCSLLIHFPVRLCLAIRQIQSPDVAPPGCTRSSPCQTCPFRFRSALLEGMGHRWAIPCFSSSYISRIIVTGISKSTAFLHHNVRLRPESSESRENTFLCLFQLFSIRKGGKKRKVRCRVRGI